jgi:beta-lactamase superfamily II metal-dependent hydrolase
VSHYLAGDALWKEEAEIAAWINQPVLFIKLSHHGGAYSSPAAVFNTYQPTKIIVSAGRAHRHPGKLLRRRSLVDTHGFANDVRFSTVAMVISLDHSDHRSN